MKRTKLWEVPFTFRLGRAEYDALAHEAQVAHEPMSRVLRTALARELNFRRGLRTRRTV